MTRYFIYFSYDGTNYHGWQIQPNGNTIQAEMHHALSVLLRKQIEVIGAGRTDTGVHARLMVAHFDGDDNIDVVQLAYRLNRILPQDIAVHEVKPVSEDMHARFSAKSRTYRYYIHFKKNPFHRAYSYEIHYDLDFDAMNNAASYLLKQSDFTSFCKTGTIEVGRHRMDFDAFKKVISDKTRTAAGESMPGHALFLEDITY